MALVVLVATIVAALAAAARAGDEGVPTMRLRMEWGGGGEQQWQGTVRLADGNLSDPLPLGIEADEPGSMWIGVDGALAIRPRSARSYDGVDFTVTAPLGASFNVTLAGGGAEPGLDVQVPLSRVANDVYASPLDNAGNRLLIRRMPGDRLRVKLDHDSVIYSPAEVAQIEVLPNLASTGSPTRVRLVVQLFAARSTRDPLWSNERELGLTADGQAAEPVRLDVKLPEAEGVYDLRITVHRRALPNRLGWKQAIEERKVQLVVLDSRPVVAAGAAPLPVVAETLFELDPANPRWWERLANAPLIPGLRRGPLGNGDAAPWHHALAELIQLGPGGREPNVSWEAFPLPVARPGQPHVVEVEYPSDVPQTMGISIVEPNTAGVVAPIGLDSGVYLPDDVAGGTPQLAKHRLIFWPRTKAPLLLITNQRDGSRAVFGKVRVIGPKPSPAPGLSRDTGRPVYLPAAFGAEAPAGNRLLAGYYDRPLFPENFSASEAFDDWSGRGLDDWVTFYEGATRLVEYLKHVGYSGLVMTVLADGSTIYPSRLLEPTPRYDNGVLFATGQDPIRKDVLELLFRLFDRAGLQLVPALQFSAPLPELEALRRRGGPQSAGIELVSAAGKPWLAEHPPRKGLAPYYNPLSVHVQDAMLAVAGELCHRYGRQHDSFAGLALHLSADGYAQLPGADGGYDQETIDRFVRERSLAALARQDYATRVKMIATEYQQAWLDWRCQEMNRLHNRMQIEVARVKGGAKLYLAGARLFDRPEIEQALRPALARPDNVETVLRTLGIDPKLYQTSDDVVLLRPQWIAPGHSLAAHAAALELNQSPELDRDMHAARSAGALFFHEPQQMRVPSFDAQSPFKGTHTLLVSQPSPSAALNRRRFVHALATLDAAAMIDGGWLLPLGEEDALADLVAAYRELPAAPFETVPGASQPVTVRRHSGPDGTHVYFVNDSPWNARVTVELTAPPGCALVRFGKSRRLPAVAATGQPQQWVVDLEPFGLLAGRFGAAEVHFAQPQVTFQQNVENDLYLRIRDLGERVAALAQPATLATLANPSFEQPPDANDPLPGWTFREQDGAHLDLDSEHKHTGAQSVHLTSTLAAASLVSAPVTSLRTGRLLMLVRLRVADGKRQPPLRLATSGRWRGQDYYRYAQVGAGASTTPIGTEWTQYLFTVQDLPTDDFTDLRVRFDLTGPGDVWIDDVEVREFGDDDISELKKLVTVAVYTLESRQYGDCLRLLEGYWPRFLVENVHLTQGPATARPTYVPRKTEAAKPIEPEPKTGLWDRFRRTMPSFLR
ncbi:MAG: hypothetical protein HYX69_18810 [Planctomycetia bacterium]|nr:hypothetical protein [Planctomycetia bacterium]